MTQNAVPDTSAGDPTPELTESSLIKAVTLLNKYGFNIEIPNTGTAGPINIKRALNVSGSVTIPASSGMVLNVSQSVLRATILQQTVGTDDERTYLLNNASPPAGAFSNDMLYDKTGAGASFYMQRAGAHTFATAPIGTADQVATFTSRVKIDLNGLTVLSGAVAIQNSQSVAAAFVSGSSSGNMAAFAIAGVSAAGEYIAGSAAADTALRANQGNLVMGAYAGNTTIGSATKIFARFNTDGTVLVPGTNNASAINGGFSVGMGVTTTVGAGSNGAQTSKGFWIFPVNNPVFTGGGMQLNAQNGLDFWTGNANTTAWIRSLQLQTNGKVLMGGVQAATAIGDLHINYVGEDTSGSLSLTGLAGPSSIVMGNRDSMGTAGPAVIASSNRQIQIGVGDSYALRGGGNFTQHAVFSGGSFGIGITNPETVDKLVVDVKGPTIVTQLFRTLTSQMSGNTPGNLAGGYGMQWGNVYIGNRAIHGGDGNNAGMAIMVAKSGNSVEGVRVDLNSNLTVRGDTVFLGTNTVNILGCDSGNNLYVRGSSVVLQNPSGTVNYLQASASVITANIDVQINGNLGVSGTIAAYRQIEKTSDKVAGSGVVAYDYATNSTWVTTAPTGNFTPNFTNVPTTTSQVITVTLIVQQGATGYIPNSLQINGGAVTVKWAGGMAPIATPSNIDVFVFSLIRTTSNTWIVLASATPYV